MNNFNYNIILLTFLATLFTFLITTLGSSIVFFFKKVNKNVLDAMLGVSAGVMISASFFSLLNPAIILSENLNMISWLVLLIGFTLGGILLYITGLIFDRKLSKKKTICKCRRLCFSDRRAEGFLQLSIFCKKGHHSQSNRRNHGAAI